MPIDDEDDLFNEEFDLVDDDEYGSDLEDEDDDEDDDAEDSESDDDDDKQDSEPAVDQEAKEAAEAAEANEAKKPTQKKPVEKSPRGKGSDEQGESDGDDSAADSEEGLDEYGRPAPEANYVVHIYEYQKFKRSIERPFTPEDAEAFATEYNRTGKVYSRFAVAGKNDVKPKKALD